MDPPARELVPDAFCVRASAALAHGDPLAALQAVSAREDAHALALRAIALAQLGETADARPLLQRAAMLFEAGGADRYALRARAALAEIAAAERDLLTARAELEAVASALEERGDAANAAWTRLVLARACVLLGDLERGDALVRRCLAWAQEAEVALVAGAAELAAAEADSRALRVRRALAALERAAAWAERGGIATLAAEVARHRAGLAGSVARVCYALGGDERSEAELSGFELEGVLTGVAPPAPLAGRHRWLVVDALRRRVVAVAAGPSADVRAGDLARRGVLFELLLELARAWPGSASAAALARTLHGADEVDESHTARLKTEVARLRRDLAGRASIAAIGGGWQLEPGKGAALVLVEALRGEPPTLLEALLWDGAAWSARALAAATGRPLRSVQRELARLVDRGRVRALGGSRSMRYARVDEPLGFAPQMFLVAWPVGDDMGVAPLLAPRRGVER